MAKYNPPKNKLIKGSDGTPLNFTDGDTLSFFNVASTNTKEFTTFINTVKAGNMHVSLDMSNFDQKPATLAKVIKTLIDNQIDDNVQLVGVAHNHIPAHYGIDN